MVNGALDVVNTMSAPISASFKSVTGRAQICHSSASARAVSNVRLSTVIPVTPRCASPLTTVRAISPAPITSTERLASDPSRFSALVMPSELTDAEPLLIAVSVCARLAAWIAARNSSDIAAPIRSWS
jgi:hypothetical protein